MSRSTSHAEPVPVVPIPELPPPPPARRARRSVPLKVSIILAVVTGVGLLLLLALGAVLGGFTSIPVPSTPERVYRAGPVGPSYFREDFEEPPYRLTTIRDGNAVLMVVDGEYRIALEPATSAQLVRTSGEPVDGVDVEATLERVPGIPGAMYGIGCFTGVERGYFLMLLPDGRVGLGSIQGAAGGRDLSLLEIDDLAPQGPNRLRIMCVCETDGVSLGAWVNGSPLVAVRDPTGPPTVIGVGVAVSAPRGIELHVDDLVARAADGAALDELPSTGDRAADALGVYAGHGVSFRYPDAWSVRDAHARVPGQPAIWALSIAPGGGAFRHEGVYVVTSFAGVATAREIMTSRLELYVDTLGGVPHGPRAIDVGGVRGSDGSIEGFTRYGRTLDLRLVVLVLDGIAYQISCQYEPGDETITAGCDQIVDSFRFVDG